MKHPWSAPPLGARVLRLLRANRWRHPYNLDANGPMKHPWSAPPFGRPKMFCLLHREDHWGAEKTHDHLLKQTKRSRHPRYLGANRPVKHSWSALCPEMRGCLRRNWPDHLADGISKPRIARISQAKRAGPPQVTASPNPKVSRMFQAKWAGQHLARHLGAQICDDVSGETGRTSSDLVISKDRRVRMSQAKPARPAQDFENVSTRGTLGRHSFLPQLCPPMPAGQPENTLRNRNFITATNENLPHM